ncbi:MAG TPA: contact-dependent growth inhibition system immunity protein [Pirellulales bacterium]|nr:contact-dependent growth inhibition system immunity protein [Pirellulales bacterium]
MTDVDRPNTLEELEQADWGAPTYESHLASECHRLRRIPLRELRTEDLRIMIAQQIGLLYLVPSQTPSVSDSVCFQMRREAGRCD